MNVSGAIRVLACVVIPLSISLACGSEPSRGGYDTDAGNKGPGFGQDGGPTSIGGRDPVNCEEAAAFKTYVGCDYWPTVTDNLVADVFDFAVAVANNGAETAHVTVTGPDGVDETATVASGAIGKIYLPWVRPLKAPEGEIVQASILAPKSAYHLVSDVPVVVYQFSPLEFRAAGGKPGKDWSSCVASPGQPECYSYSNDASLLLPSTAMTGDYRIMGSYGWSRHPVDQLTGEVLTNQPLVDLVAPYFVVTGTADGTSVKVKLTAKGSVTGGSGIDATPGGGTVTFMLDAGDVAEVVGAVGQNSDFSGSLLTADKPVQVITGVTCIFFPLDVQACDHIEETVFPAQTLGKHYVVMPPTGPRQNDVGHIVRFYGNVDGTTLTYTPSKPPSCPATLDAGEVVDCGKVTSAFEVEGDHEFGVGMFQLGGVDVDSEFTPIPGVQPQGDPAQSFAVTVEQYRKRYVFLAPTDYKTSFVDIVASGDTALTLDGKDVSSSLAPISGTTYFSARLALGTGKAGVHELEGSEPIGIQVIGYGENTSYQYPGGLNLSAISAAPVK